MFSCRLSLHLLFLPDRAKSSKMFKIQPDGNIEIRVNRREFSKLEEETKDFFENHIVLNGESGVRLFLGCSQSEIFSRIQSNNGVQVIVPAGDDDRIYLVNLSAAASRLLKSRGEYTAKYAPKERVDALVQMYLEN